MKWNLKKLINSPRDVKRRLLGRLLADGVAVAVVVAVRRRGVVDKLYQ
jgi:hypothetical protein